MPVLTAQKNENPANQGQKSNPFVQTHHHGRFFDKFLGDTSDPRRCGVRGACGRGRWSHGFLSPRRPLCGRALPIRSISIGAGGAVAAMSYFKGENRRPYQRQGLHPPRGNPLPEASFLRPHPEPAATRLFIFWVVYRGAEAPCSPLAQRSSPHARPRPAQASLRLLSRA